MKEEIIFTRNYRQLFREAHETNNIYRMADIFDALCNEVGMPDPGRDKIQEAAGKALADLLNSRGKGPEAKRL